MKHQDIVRLVNSMDIAELTPETFDGFVQNAHGLFVLKGEKFQEYYSPGYNPSSKDKYDFSKAKPEYRSDLVLTFDHIAPRELAGGRKWINVHLVFKENDRDMGTDFTSVWGINPGKLPLKFGFDPGKALYIAQQSGNGTPEMPWETVYLKIK